MKKIIRTSLSLFILLVLSACNLFSSANNAITGETPVLRLTVQTHDRTGTFRQVGQVINYDYVITNTGTARLAGPAIVMDEARLVTCPDVATAGNLDIYLDLNETLTCTSTYAITQSDVNTRSVTNLATANVGGVNSNQSGVTLTLAAAPVLTLTKTASSQTYGQVGEIITYNFSITNTGANPLGPTQFVITDSKLGGPLPCGPAATTLAPSQRVDCAFPYTITQADMAAASLMNSASASGADQTSASATVTISNLSGVAGTQTASAIQTATLAPSPSNLAPGSTIQHPVAVGEWLIQIGRCYGANFEDMRNANPQIADPNFILPSMMITVPRIGSVGKIWGPPCVTFYTVQSGDSWESIAQRYDANLVVLHKVNPVTLTAGTVIKIPLHSAGAGGVIPVTATATATATATTTTTAQRITIPAGQTTLTVAGVVNAGQTAQYVLNTAVGQVLNISLTGPTNTEATLGVNGPTGLVLKQPDGAFTWNTTITTGGDYFINITGLAGVQNKASMLTVSLTSPTAATATFTATATATPTVTNTPTTPNP